jgi:2-keto-4-pentenoate hydratase/2-oxohepta-3-ene-1,7-dioic acid hydratase in catechol pathway
MSLRLASFRVNGRASYGVVTDKGVIDLGRKLSGKYPALIDVLRADAVGEARQAASGQPDHQLSEVELLIPVVGGEKIICVGINYPERNEEYKDGRPTPKYPNLFVRFPSSFVGSEQPLVRPKVSDKFDYEGEIVLVIGKEGRNIPKEQALKHIGGLTLGNEGSIRDWIRHGTLNVTQGKNFDRSGSFGPWIETDLKRLDLDHLRLETRVNGELRQSDTTASMTFSFARIIEYVSTFTTLLPGDLIATGTPTGSGGRFDPPKWLKEGDVVDVTVEGLGALKNGVTRE